MTSARSAEYFIILITRISIRVLNGPAQIAHLMQSGLGLDSDDSFENCLGVLPIHGEEKVYGEIADAMIKFLHPDGTSYMGLTRENNCWLLLISILTSIEVPKIVLCLNKN